MHTNGAFTGDISASMLVDVGCQYVILGHSERRMGYNESNALIQMKANVAQSMGLVPIVCVGETAEERNLGKEKDVVKTLTKSRCEITLVGGGKLRIGENSELEITEANVKPMEKNFGATLKKGNVRELREFQNKLKNLIN